MRRYKAGGFTLIELMIAVAIVGILAAIAYPSYSSHLRKGRRAEAQSYLLDIAQREQQYFIDRRSYALDVGPVTAATTLNGPAPATSLTTYYTITTVARSGVTPSFIISATPIAGKAQAPDGTLTIDDTGAKTPTGSW